MKYILQVNQDMAIKLGIANIQQAIIFDLLSMASTWAKPEIIDNQHFYWVARQHISRELPFLKLKLDSIYRHLKHLDKIGLIVYKKLGKKDCIILTEKGKSYYVGDKSEKHDLNAAAMSEINPNKLGNKSEKHSEIFPTDQTTIVYQTTRLSSNTSEPKNKPIKINETTAQATEIAFYLNNKIKSINPYSITKPDGWVKEIEFAIRLDKRTPENLKILIDHIYTDENTFWIDNILSGTKLRKHFDRIWMQYLNKQNKPKKPLTPRQQMEEDHRKQNETLKQQSEVEINPFTQASEFYAN